MIEAPFKRQRDAGKAETLGSDRETELTTRSLVILFSRCRRTVA